MNLNILLNKCVICRPYFVICHRSWHILCGPGGSHFCSCRTPYMRICDASTKEFANEMAKRNLISTLSGGREVTSTIQKHRLFHQLCRICPLMQQTSPPR